jgi:hypothetical protein
MIMESSMLSLPSMNVFSFLDAIKKVHFDANWKAVEDAIQKFLKDARKRKLNSHDAD